MARWGLCCFTVLFFIASTARAEGSATEDFFEKVNAAGRRIAERSCVPMNSRISIELPSCRLTRGAFPYDRDQMPAMRTILVRRG